MPEAFFKTGDERLYVRHNDPTPERRTLLFIHGLGDSGLSFEDVFDDARFDGFNLVVPDLVGYGRSSGSSRRDGYGFESHLARLWDLIRTWNLPPLIIIGHSMGGDLSTLLCKSDTGGVIEGFVNIDRYKGRFVFKPANKA
ncbi:MAG: alpha/beta fold hydrolase [candidate division Zixibacteria bacterium]|nr:alpha/beta fold hydrolase [candidate division Zixibacteria bacterium]